nr:MAG TPA: hypothetical protein [Caudoviricetes sp.]
MNYLVIEILGVLLLLKEYRESFIMVEYTLIIIQGKQA